jgi:sugar lactone lactonase YvrE
MTEIANESAGLNFPNDLEFHPFADRENELWVLCPGSDQTGGHTVTFFDPLTDPDNYEWRRDGNAWHFMALSTGLAFGENGNWATSQGIPDANRMGMFFTGPSLWSSDMAIYARVGERPTSQVNGSHLDMIHQSPMGMGIAHEIDNIYWVFDGFHSTLCRYDFAEPHYPGGYDHSDGKVWRFSEPVVKMSGNTSIPSHMVLDKETGILYICDTGNKRVIKVDIGSARARLGTPGVNLLHGEPLALYQEMVGATWEVVSDQGFDSPSGIALIANRLFVSDFNTGAIHCLDKSSHEKLGSYDSKTPGIAGLEVGPDGKLWFVNALENKLLRLDPAPVVLP